MAEQPIATKPEIIVYQWLTKHNIIFSFQTALMGGHFELGGSVVDFILTELDIALRVQGMYWHEGIAKKGTDEVQREMLESIGLTVVDLWEEDILNRLETTMQLAVQGQEVLH